MLGGRARTAAVDCGSHADGCPRWFENDRFEHSGRVKGVLRVGAHHRKWLIAQAALNEGSMTLEMVGVNQGVGFPLIVSLHLQNTTPTIVTIGTLFATAAVLIAIRERHCSCRPRARAGEDTLPRIERRGAGLTSTPAGCPVRRTLHAQ